ncbi:LysR family transcriptional regulator [Duganella sp. FT135W]|uniref:LysR family transcriptional regulator n=1 Tax=Duganella flavida TaxID=2692175 RepID=A0A6L8K2J3_9BURK|nr:LysR family transcriptional regulator [Duganella flavida]MYM21135.1 LysR family transcriptional regulator [Duganella flavida]
MKLVLDELSVFLAVVDSGSLTAAADRLGQPVSNVSRLLARLEDKLQTSLLRRTTRRLDLTDEGHAFIQDARDIVASVCSAEERMMERRGQLSGPLRVDAVTPFMLHVMVPLMPGYRALHPKVELKLSSNEGFIDLLERRVDMAIRIGELKDSTLYSRLLGHTRIRLTASPGYLARYGTPHTVADLARHELLGFSELEMLNQWPLLRPDGKPLQITPTLASPSGETLRQLALQGMGIMSMSDFMTAVDVAEGRLVEVLPQLTQERLKPVHAVYYQHSTVSAKVASMVNYLADAMRVAETAWPTLGRA